MKLLKRKEKKEKKEKKISEHCPVREAILVLSLMVIGIQRMLRLSTDAMKKLSEELVRPIHRALSVLNAGVNFSVAELVIALAVAAVAAYAVWLLIRLVRGPKRIQTFLRGILTCLCAVTFVYACFCVLWGIYYYGEDFTEKSGLKEDPISTEQLQETTAYFAELLNTYSQRVTRDENGLYTADRKAILGRSDEVFGNIEKEFPCLEGPSIRAKGILFSKIMSYTDFTGFFFPFTAEANVNMDFPAGLFASTVAHELSHQRGVAKEQEANFTAVLACLAYGDDDYCYSAAMLAYTHLGNALFSADREAWLTVYSTLDENVLKDFAANRAYWKQFETPVQEVSNTVYENFLFSYDQTMGLKSYGACVDLLVNYFGDGSNIKIGA